MTATNPKLPVISVIIPTYFDWDRLQLCLNALQEQTYPQEYFEILVVNNAPSDVAPGAFLLPGNCTILEETKAGSYAARNKALSVAKGDIYAFTDSDCQPQSDWLENAMSLFDDPKVDRIGGGISLIYKGEKPTVSEVYEMAYAFRQEDFVNEKGMAATGNMISRKTVFESIGLFNDNLMSGGDSEWGVRASRKGFNIIYSESCIVWHPTRSRLSELTQKTRREAGGHYALNKGNKNKLLLSVLLGILPPIKSIFRISKDKKMSFKEKCIAVLIRYYLRLLSVIETVLIMLSIKKSERQ